MLVEVASATSATWVDPKTTMILHSLSLQVAVAGEVRRDQEDGLVCGGVTSVSLVRPELGSTKRTVSHVPEDLV